MSDLPATPGTACPECGTLRAALEEAQQPIALLRAELHELRCQLNRNSSNSSSPPSADPPGAPKPVVKTKSGRKPGGQPGHPGSPRLRLPPDRVQQIIPYGPAICTRCQAPLPERPAPGDPEPSWHQVAELPPLAAIIIEHQGQARTCPCSGHLNRAEIPPEIRAHVIGPRLAAMMSYLSGRHHLSRRAVEEIVETAFEGPVALGTVITLEAETTAALAGAYQEVQGAVRGAAVKNTDETGWSEAGPKRWLWMAASATAALFVIHLRRSFAGLTALLGEMISGVVCSDRRSAYSQLPLERRQICWAHTIRTQSRTGTDRRRPLRLALSSTS
jgi:transposase